MQIEHKRLKVGFIGTGVMGISMAGHIMAAGHEVYLYTRTKAKANALLSKGAQWSTSVQELAQQCEVIITMVGYPSDVEQIYFGEGGLIAHAAQGALLIDMTTSSPLLAKKISNEAKTKGLYVIDAPVSGGDVGAQNATLSIMVGGDLEATKLAQPILELMGSNIIRQGDAGAGQHTKMCNQIAIATNMIGVCEAIYYATKAGLDPLNVLQSIQTGAAGSWSLSNLAPRIIANNDEPGFYVKHFIKDMKIALESAIALDIQLPGLELALSLYEKLAEMGYDEKGTQALYRVFTA